MGYNRGKMTGITHNVHVRTEDGDIQSFEGVLDAMKLPNETLKFTHNNEVKQFSNGEIIRSRVKNVDDAHKYVCPDCESDETALISATDYGPMLEVTCQECRCIDGFERREV